MINGQIVYFLKKWNKLEYVNDDIINLLDAFFKYEPHRINMKQIKKNEWLNMH